MLGGQDCQAAPGQTGDLAAAAAGAGAAAAAVGWLLEAGRCWLDGLGQQWGTPRGAGGHCCLASASGSSNTATTSSSSSNTLQSCIAAMAVAAVAAQLLLGASFPTFWQAWLGI